MIMWNPAWKEEKEKQDRYKDSCSKDILEFGYFLVLQSTEVSEHKPFECL